MKIGLEKGMFAGVLLGVVGFGVSGWEILTSVPPIIAIIGPVLGVIMLVAAVLFAKIPFCTIVFRNGYFVVPYAPLADKTWNGKQGFIKSWGSIIFFYRKKISREAVRYVILCQYADIPKVLGQISDDSQGKNKIAAYTENSLQLAPYFNSEIEKTAIVTGVAQGIVSGGISAGGIDNVAGAAMEKYAIADAVKNNFVFALRTADEMIISTIGMERRRSDCKPFAEYLSSQGIRVIS